MALNATPDWTEKALLPMRYYKFAKMALDAARLLDNGMTHQLCAFVISKNRILSVGYNSRKTSPIMTTKMRMLHAECDALLRCPDADAEGSEVIVVRSRPSGKPGLSRPCEVCQGILRRFGIRRVMYTINSEDADNPQLEEMRL